MLAHELIHPRVLEEAVAVRVDVHARRWARTLTVEAHAERDRLARASGQDRVRVACVKPEGDTAAGPPEHDPLGPDRPFTVEPPSVEPQGLVGQALAARVPEIGLGRVELVPVSGGLDAIPSTATGSRSMASNR